MVEWIVCSIVVGLFIFLYGTSAIIESVNYADANDLILAARYFGLAHPPGYPLFVIFYGSLFRLWPMFTSSQIAGWTSAGLMAIAAGLVCRLLINIFKSGNQRFISGLIIAPALSVLWGTTLSNWILATVPEIMPLGLVLTLIFLLVSFQIITSHQVRRLSWLASGFLGILSGLYHPLLLGLVMWTFAGLWFIRKLSFKSWIYYFMAGNAAGFIVTVLMYGFISWSAGGYSWQVPQNLSQWWQFWSRQVYLDTGSAIESLNRDNSAQKTLLSIVSWGREWFVNHQGGWWMAALVASLWSIKKGKSTLGLWILGLLLIYGPLLAGYMKHPEHFQVSEVALWSGIALRERMFYIWELLLVASTGLGVLEILKSDFRFKRQILSIMTLALIFTAANQALTQHRRYGNEAVNASSVYNDQLLTSLPEGSVVIIDDDEVFGLLASHLDRKIRPDLLIVPTGMVLQPDVWKNKMDEFSRFGFSSLKSLYVADIVETSLSKNRNVFLYAADAEVLSYLGVEGNPWYGIPYGYFLKISKTPEPVEAYNFGFSVQMEPYSSDLSPANFKWFRSNLGLLHTQQAYYLARLGYEAEALWHAKQADSFFYKEDSKKTVKYTLESGLERYKLQGSYFSYQPQNADWWLNQGAGYITALKTDEALYCYTRALMLQPSNELVRKQVVGLYQKLGRNAEAYEENLRFESQAW